MYDYDRRASTDTLSPSEVSRLPVGSIVVVVGDSNFLVVVPDGVAPISMLPERDGSHVPEGEPANQWGNVEWALVSKGKGKVPTHATAQRAAITWARNQGR